MTDFSAIIGGSIPVTLRMSDARLSDVAHNLLLARGHRSGVPRVHGIDRNEPRELAGSLFIDGSSKDNAIAQLAAINALLRDGTTLTLQSRDATNAVSLNVLPSALSVPQLGNVAWENDHAGWVPCRLTCEPYAYGPETKLASAVSATYPNVVDVTVPGDYPAPLQLTFAAAGGNLHCLYAGLLPEQVTALPIWEAEALTWVGGTSSSYADAAAHGSARKQNASTLLAVAPAPDTALPPATYAMLGRVAQSAAGTSTFKVGSEQRQLTSAIGYRLEEFGRAHLPTISTRAGAPSELPIGMAASAGSSYFDYLGALPISWGWLSWHPPSGSTVASTLVREYDGRIYANHRADGVNGRGGRFDAVGQQRIVVFADTAHGSGAAGGTIDLLTTVKVIPRYALWA